MLAKDIAIAASQHDAAIMIAINLNIDFIYILCLNSFVFFRFSWIPLYSICFPIDYTFITKQMELKNYLVRVFAIPNNPGQSKSVNQILSQSLIANVRNFPESFFLPM